jgi:hypothetical protein
MIDHNIQKTSNQAELSFSNTLSKGRKKRFKTKSGILGHNIPIFKVKR